MTRENAIAIIRKEYLCVDRDCDIERSCGKCDLMMPSKKPILEAYKAAIKALEQEPCEDAISREDALMALTGEWPESIEELIHRFNRRIKTLPSVIPSRPTGHWIGIDDEPHEDYECDGCGYVCSTFTANIKPYEEYKYCPNCGAKMEGQP